MSRLRLRLDGEPGAISFETFVYTLRDSLTALRDLDSAISKNPKGSLSWFVQNLQTDSLVTDVLARGTVADTVTGAFVDGVRDLESEASTPPYFSEECLRAVRRIAARIGNDGATGFRAIELDRKIEGRVTELTDAHIKSALATPYQSVGSVTGTIEMISVHGAPRMNVYDSLNNRAVRCNIPLDQKDELLAQVTALLGRRVIAAGRVSRNLAGDAVKVQLRSLTPLPDDDELPTVAEVAGSEPDFTGDLSTQEYLDRLRNA